jgi:hypothetical protein
VVVALAFLALAISHSVYDLTSPAWLSWHIVLRKAYSIVAFSIVAFFLRMAIRERGGTAGYAGTALALALYSAAIEVGQFLHGSREGLSWNAVDVVCGGIGGLIASALPLPKRSR